MEVFQKETLCVDAENIINLTNPTLAEEWVFSKAHVLFYTFFQPLITAIGVSGNVAFLISALIVPNMQSSLTAFMCNLAVTDIIFLVMAEIWAVLDYKFSKIVLDYPVYFDVSCYALVMSVYIPYFVSLGFVTLISMERYLAICMPIRHHMMKGRNRSARMIGAVWAIGFILAILYTSGHTLIKTCFLWPHREPFSDLPIVIGLCWPYTLQVQIMSISLFLLCLIMNTAISGKIALTMMNRKLASNYGQKQMQSATNQVTRTLVLNNVIFFLCQLPIRFAFSDKIMESFGIDV